ncbi:MULTISPECIES: sugar nucleotide-binding protein [unclassified Meiothermus]|uniref:SDR family oxidoreductase n=1 Tax=unclassified Meiothermus TaxID=370471 RepID=UPI000D7BCCCA|nr:MULTISPECIES: sugar nucleotide-binding protein [unclassified Meiothermus]PZA06825.1 NAD(P)-dependent oxidoreductase [Meiothermus sp. Pnk-1]RYM33105.1 NAD(P)-dependent oxidoreductase [Meiothermus sp. PNK-Is4]
MGPILMTGGSGRLGRALRALMPGIVAPPRRELDVTDPESVRAALERHQPKVFLHAAAYTDVARAERERAACWRVNVEGTRNVVRALQGSGVFLVHISTDYVFWGDRGGYREDDPMGPVRNHYALSKLVAEEVVRVLPRHLVIRTSFRPSPWPYPVAYTDLYTSQDYLEVIAPEVALALEHLGQIPFDTLHIATERKSAYELARRTREDVLPGLRADSPVALPEDISLDNRRWQSLKREWRR